MTGKKTSAKTTKRAAQKGGRSLGPKKPSSAKKSPAKSADRAVCAKNKPSPVKKKSAAKAPAQKKPQKTTSRKKTPAKKATPKKRVEKEVFPWQAAGEKTRGKYRNPWRPPKFDTAEALYEGVLAYLEQCDQRKKEVAVRTVTGTDVVEVVDPAPKCVKSLCQFLGITTTTWYVYAQKNHPYHVVCEWFDTISEVSWYEIGEDPHRSKLAMFVLQCKHNHVIKKDLVSDGKRIGGVSWAGVLEELDGDGFKLPGDEETDD